MDPSKDTSDIAGKYIQDSNLDEVVLVRTPALAMKFKNSEEAMEYWRDSSRSRQDFAVKNYQELQFFNVEVREIDPEMTEEGEHA